MKKSFILQPFLWCMLLFLTIGNVYAQQEDLPHGPKSAIMNPAAECTGTGQLIYDDGVFENGYGWNPTVTDGRFVQLFTPTAYPWQFNTFCLALTRLAAGTPTFTFDIVMYADAGGTPGAELGVVSGVTAINIPVWTTLAFYDYDVTSLPPVTSGSVFLGIKYNPSLDASPHYSGADESTTTTLHPGFAWSGTAWAATQTLFTGYRAMSYRTLGSSGPPCTVGVVTNPTPANGATNVNINLSSISWTNGAGATSVEVFFNGVSVYSGAPTTSYSIPAPLNYSTTYTWKVNGSNGTCTTFGPNWTFTTMSNPSIITDNVYPMNVSMWTGTTNGTTKTDGEINTVFPNVGWAAFDLSSILPGSQILSLQFYGYVNATNWPWWSATPMGAINPVSATGSAISAQIQANRATGVAYIYSDEGSTFAPGWHDYPLGNSAVTDFQNALSQGWFAMGFVDRDDLATYYINFDGWSQTNKPYIAVTYVPIPVELTSFNATASVGTVELRWTTATETNNQGFEVQRSSGTEFETIAFVDGHGTTTEVQAYAYTDRNLNVSSYSYRLKQVDFDGTFEYSNTIEVDVPAPAEFALDQNYPNPFNPSTKIAFRLAIDSKVSLKIFDVLGQEVSTLVNTNLVAGSHSVNFDASALNSGVYLYRIEATGIDGSNFIDVKKMILTK